MRAAQPDREAEPPTGPGIGAGNEAANGTAGLGVGAASGIAGPLAEVVEAAEVLHRAVGLLVRQVGHWEARRWAATTDRGNVARSDLVHRLVQRVANLAADAAGEPRRSVPRLDNDLALPDQLRVVAADLVAAGPSAAVLTEAAAEVQATRAAL